MKSKALSTPIKRVQGPDGMFYAFFDVLDLLTRKTPCDRITLVKIVALDQASQLSFFENLLNLAERKFDSVILRRVRHDPNPLDCELTHQLNRIFCLVSRQIVHHYGDLLTIIKLMEFFDEATEYIRVDSTFVLLEILEAASFTD